MEERGFWRKIWDFVKKHWIISALVVIISLILILVLSGGKKAAADTVTVVRGNISEEVSVTGNVKPVKSADLAFEKTGRVVFVKAEAGDKVYAGEALVGLEKNDLEAQLSKAVADLATEQANLGKANVDLANYYGSIPNILSDAYTKADDAVRKQLSGLFNNYESQNPTLSFSTDVAIDNDVRKLRLAATNALKQWLTELSAVGGATDPNTLTTYLNNAANYLAIVRNLLLRSMDAVVYSSSNLSLSSSTADTYKSNINTGRANVNTAISNLTTQGQSIAAEGATIASLGAGIKSYQAGIDDIEAQVHKATIYAPISGVVTVQNAKVGEIAAANQVLVSVISANSFEVEANVAEADIAKVKAGDAAAVTLDAYGNGVVFDAKVSFIDPAETMVEGVATYKTKFEFSKRDERVKSGMTANITIFADKRENVLVIPQRAVTTKSGGSSVLVDLGDGKSEERSIETGLRGVDGNVEILSGLKEGERVVTNGI